MGDIDTGVILKRFEEPDETRILTRVKFEIVRVGGLTIGRASTTPGRRAEVPSSHVRVRMNRKTPNAMLVAVALLAVYATYAGWSAVTQGSWPFAVVAIGALAACIGTAMLRPWSRYLVYLLVAGVVGGWFWSLYASVRAGYFSLFSPSQISVNLAPGAFITLLSIACAFIVFRHFRKGTPREVPG